MRYTGLQNYEIVPRRARDRGCTVLGSYEYSSEKQVQRKNTAANVGLRTYVRHTEIHNQSFFARKWHKYNGKVQSLRLLARTISPKPPD